MSTKNMINMYESVFMERTVLYLQGAYAQTNYPHFSLITKFSSQSDCFESTMPYCGAINVEEHCVDVMVDSQPRVQLP